MIQSKKCTNYNFFLDFAYFSLGQILRRGLALPQHRRDTRCQLVSPIAMKYNCYTDLRLGQEQARSALKLELVRPITVTYNCYSDLSLCQVKLDKVSVAGYVIRVSSITVTYICYTDLTFRVRTRGLFGTLFVTRLTYQGKLKVYQNISKIFYKRDNNVMHYSTCNDLMIFI